MNHKSKRKSKDKKPFKKAIIKKRKNFQNTTFFCLFLFLSLITVTYVQLFNVSEKDRFRYFKLMEESNPSACDKSKKASYTASQKRQKIRKDVYYTANGNLMHLLLTSNDAVLLFNQKQEGPSYLVEEMKDVKCYMQEELFYVDARGDRVEIKGNIPKGIKPMQLVRYCKTDNASYCYQTKLLTSSDVFIARYLAPGHTIESVHFENLAPVMQGTAEAVEFSLGGKELAFKAEKLKAKFTKGESL